MVELSNWTYNEYRQTGKDYSTSEEVNAYDASHAQFRDAIAESNEILDGLGAIAGQTVIDFGCGTGEFAIQAALRGLTVLAVDVSQTMLDRARSKAKAREIETIQFYTGGFLDFSPNLGSVDAIVTSYSFHHLPDFWKGIALKRCAQMLEPHGILFIQDVVIEAALCIENINAFVRQQENLGGDFLRDDAIGHFQEEYSTYDWILEGLLARSNFTIREKKIQGGLLAQYTCVKAS